MRVLRGLTACSVVLLAGCRLGDVTNGKGEEPGKSITPVSSPSSARREPMRTIDDEFSEFVQDLPGFGGLYVEGASEDSPGRLTVVVTNPGALPEQAVRARVTAFLRRTRDSDLAALVDRQGVTVVRGDYDFSQLKRWYPHAIALLGQDGVLSTDIDERTNRIAVGVSSEAVRATVQQALERAGVPRGAVRVEITGRAVPAVRLSDMVRPVAGGVAINNDIGNLRCTLGYNTTYNGARVFVTNSHCTDQFAAVTGMVSYQPRYGASNAQIGYEVWDPPFFQSDVDSRCPATVSLGCRYSDAALFQYYDNVATSRDGADNWIANVGSGTDSLSTIIGYHQLFDYNVLTFVGQSVAKIGSRTGYTSGTVTSTCQHFSINGYVMLCQATGNFRVQGGDSGSPVYTKNSSGTRLQGGLVWGYNFDNGNGLFSPNNNINFEVFGCRVCQVPS